MAIWPSWLAIAHQETRAPRRERPGPGAPSSRLPRQGRSTLVAGFGRRRPRRPPQRGDGAAWLGSGAVDTVARRSRPCSPGRSILVTRPITIVRCPRRGPRRAAAVRWALALLVVLIWAAAAGRAAGAEEAGGAPAVGAGGAPADPLQSLTEPVGAVLGALAPAVEAITVPVASSLQPLEPALRSLTAPVAAAAASLAPAVAALAAPAAGGSNGIDTLAGALQPLGTRLAAAAAPIARALAPPGTPAVPGTTPGTGMPPTEGAP
ncbi:MAG: hypothetical protein QOK40_1147, partial [Miltoncostaeaceae bacterium]|nr:hypothetical protein [Miltoncostaeaceae bacterium]